MTKKLENSSGDVFADLGFSADESEGLRIRSELMVALRSLIEKRGLSQAAAAKMFGVSQPRVSDLVRGKIELFSIETLVEFLVRSGHRVRFSVSPVSSKHVRSRAA